MAFVKYIGSKNMMSRHILKRLRATGRSCLVDVFGGSGSITILSDFPKRIYNDTNGDLVNMFRVVASPQLRPRLLKKLRWTPMSREIFENDYRKKFIPGGYSFRLVTDPVDRAHLTFYRLKFCFGGKYSTGGFQVSSQNRNIIKELSAYRNSLREFSRIGGIFKNTVIENHDFLKIISLYGNKRDTVLFIDPPYFNKGDYYVGGFSHGQHEFLAHALAECDAPVVCTFYDCSELRDLYPQRYWNYDHVKATKNVSGARSPKSRSSVEMILTKKGQGEMISDGIKK